MFVLLLHEDRPGRPHPASQICLYFLRPSYVVSLWLFSQESKNGVTSDERPPQLRAWLLLSCLLPWRPLPSAWGALPTPLAFQETGIWAQGMCCLLGPALGILPEPWAPQGPCSRGASATEWTLIMGTWKNRNFSSIHCWYRDKSTRHFLIVSVWRVAKYHLHIKTDILILRWTTMEKSFFVTYVFIFCCCSVAQWHPTLCDPRDCSKPGLPVLHRLLEFAQTRVHWVSDAVQPSHPLLSPSPPAFNLFQHQDLFQWVSSLHQVAKVLEFQLQHQSFQWTPRTDLL